MDKLKIVLIEDDEILAKVIYEELIEAGFDVSQAFDGEEGLRMVRAEKPDLVLLDLVLPKKQGFGVLEELKESPLTRSIPVIVLTMLGRDDDIKKGIRLGANDYIVKSQHAIGEIVDRVINFFGKEQHPEAKQSKNSTSGPNLTDYIKRARGAGVADADIKKALEKAGWGDKNIEKALRT